MSQFPAPPNYRKSRTVLNPNSELLGLKTLTDPPKMYIYGDDLTTSGPTGAPAYELDFGSIAASEDLDVLTAWDNSGIDTNVNTSFPRLVLGVYTGDAGAFQWEGKDLEAAPEIYPAILMPTSIQMGPTPGWGQTVTALDADAGFTMTGLLTFYTGVYLDGMTPVFTDPVATLALSKTYNP